MQDREQVRRDTVRIHIDKIADPKLRIAAHEVYDFVERLYRIDGRQTFVSVSTAFGLPTLLMHRTLAQRVTTLADASLPIQLAALGGTCIIGLGMWQLSELALFKRQRGKQIARAGKMLRSSPVHREARLCILEIDEARSDEATLNKLHTQES